MTQTEINAWVEKKSIEEKADADIAAIRQTAEVAKKALADQIAQIDYKKEADIAVIRESIGK